MKISKRTKVSQVFWHINGPENLNLVNRKKSSLAFLNAWNRQRLVIKAHPTSLMSVLSDLPPLFSLEALSYLDKFGEAKCPHLGLHITVSLGNLSHVSTTPRVLVLGHKYQTECMVIFLFNLVI